MATYKQKRKEGWRKNLECYHPEGSLKKNGRMKKKTQIFVIDSKMKNRQEGQKIPEIR